MTDWQPSDELVEKCIDVAMKSAEHDSESSLVDFQDSPGDIFNIWPDALRSVLQAAVESGELVPDGEAFYTLHEDGTVSLQWTGGYWSRISKQMCEEWVKQHNELHAARAVVEAAREVDRLLGPIHEDGVMGRGQLFHGLTEALDAYDEITNVTPATDAEGAGS